MGICNAGMAAVHSIYLTTSQANPAQLVSWTIYFSPVADRDDEIHNLQRERKMGGTSRPKCKGPQVHHNCFL